MPADLVTSTNSTGGAPLCADCGGAAGCGACAARTGAAGCDKSSASTSEKPRAEVMRETLKHPAAAAQTRPPRRAGRARVRRGGDSRTLKFPPKRARSEKKVDWPTLLFYLCRPERASFMLPVTAS